MTEATLERPNGAPLTNPVPGTWVQPPGDTLPVYVPHELVEYKDEEGTKRKRYEQSTHVKRIILEGGAFINGPQDVTTPRPDVEALRALVEQQAQELAELKAKMEADRDATTATAGRKR